MYFEFDIFQHGICSKSSQKYFKKVLNLFSSLHCSPTKIFNHLQHTPYIIRSMNWLEMLLQRRKLPITDVAEFTIKLPVKMNLHVLIQYVLEGIFASTEVTRKFHITSGWMSHSFVWSKMIFTLEASLTFVTLERTRFRCIRVELFNMFAHF